MSTYVAQTGDSIAPGSVPTTELLSRVGGFIAGCGQAALLVILHAVNGQATNPDEVTNLIEQAVSQHLTVSPLAGSGDTTGAQLTELAAQNGVQLQAMDYNHALSTYAGTRDVIIGVNNASVFGGNDITVHGHYITVVGRTAQGNYIVSDPNTSESTRGQFVTYTPQQIQAANPFWAAVATGTIGPTQNTLSRNIGGGWTGGGSASGSTSGGSDSSSPPNPLDYLAQLGQFLSFFTLRSNVIRIVKVGTGVLLILLAIWVTFLGQANEPIATGLDVAGLPAAAGAVRKFSPNQASKALGQQQIQKESERAGKAGIKQGVGFQQAKQQARQQQDINKTRDFYQGLRGGARTAPEGGMGAGGGRRRPGLSQTRQEPPEAAQPGRANQPSPPVLHMPPAGNFRVGKSIGETEAQRKQQRETRERMLDIQRRAKEMDEREKQ